jgi:hypothetical protein
MSTSSKKNNVKASKIEMHNVTFSPTIKNQINFYFKLKKEA